MEKLVDERRLRQDQERMAVQGLCANSKNKNQDGVQKQDTQALVREGGVHFYCNNCSARLTKKPLRRHTLQRIFVNQLQAYAEDESSYRTVIRNLKTKVPMLQMVLVNTKIWFCSGNCFEMDMHCEESASIQDFLDYDSKGSSPTNADASKIAVDSTDKGYDCTNLVPVVKVLFRDFSSHTPDKSRAINDWAVQRHAEDIFMLEEEIKALTEALMKARLRLPASCSSLEGFYLSFLEK